MIWPQSFSGVPILSKDDMESIADSKMRKSEDDPCTRSAKRISAKW